MATFGDFEIVDNDNDDLIERPREQPRKDIERQSADEAKPNERDNSENFKSIGDFDLADFILNDLSVDVCETKHQSDSGSEFSFIEIPENQAIGTVFSDDDYSRPTTPASSEWSLLECGLISDSDTESLELTKSTSPCSSTSENENQNESISSSQQCASSKKGARKKKRKWRSKTDHKLMLELFGGLSVGEVEEDSSLLEVQTQKSSSVPTTSSVPSLTEMCMKKIHLYRKSHLIKSFIKSSHFPVGMNKTILSSNLQYSVTKSNFLWLCQNLSTVEKILTGNMNQYPFYHGEKRTGNDFYCMSSIWKELENVNSVLINACFDKDDLENYGHHIRADVQFFMVFATLMTLLMGSARRHIGKDGYHNRKNRKSKKISIDEGKSVESLHQFLKSRYPQTTKLYFKRSLPYVYWARGNFKGALQAFVDLYKGPSATDEKLFIIGEIGRLYTMIYQSEKAIKMYHLLGNCLLQAHSSKSDVIETQTRLLITDIQNQGVLTESKARNQPVVWNTVFRSCPSNRRDELYVEAADILLCLHLGNLQGDRTDGSSLGFVRDVLQEYSKNNPKVWYHRAFFSTIMGQSQESDHCYGEFIKSFGGLDGDEEFRQRVPGLRMVDLLTGRKLSHHNMDALQLAVQNPFEPLLSLGPVRALKVVWRRQFHHARGSCNNDEGCSGFDLCNPDLNLRMTDDGHITGDCSMVLPPVTSILLNPYTGFLNLDLDGKDLNPWKAFPTEDSRRPFDDWNYLPNVMEIYHNDCRKKQDEVKAYLTGNCFFKISNKTYWPGYYCEPTTDQVVYAHWNGPNGQRAKFSLVQKIKDFLYQETVDSLNSINCGPEVEKVNSLLTKWYKQGHPLASGDVGRALNIIKRDKELDKKKKKHNAQPKTAGRLYMKFVDPPQTVGNNALLTIQIYQDIYYVIIQCKDRDSFVSPIIMRPKQKTGFMVTSPRSDYMYFCVRTTDSKMTIFDSKGKEMQEIFLGVNVPFHTMALIGDNLIFFKQKRLGLMEINNGFTRYSDDFLECSLVGVLLDIVILKNEFGIKFADGRQSLCHLKPMQIRLDGSLQQSFLPFKISENGEQLNGNFEHVEVLSEDMGEMIGVFSVDNILVLFTIQNPQDSCIREVLLTKVIELPGFPTKVKFLHKSVGFLVSWSQHSLNPKVPGYREHLFQYSYSGQLRGVLPFLSRSHSSLCVVYLDGDDEVTHTYPSCGHQGWYLYVQDGRQGVMCVKLFQEDV